MVRKMTRKGQAEETNKQRRVRQVKKDIQERGETDEERMTERIE